jgi:excisionase family DNA binding protein
MRTKRAFTITEFCGRYSIGRTHAYNEIAIGRLRAVKTGRRTLVPEDSAEAWLAALPESRARTVSTVHGQHHLQETKSEPAVKDSAPPVVANLTKV